MHSKNRDAKPDRALRKRREITRQKGGGVEQTGGPGGLGGGWEWLLLGILLRLLPLAASSEQVPSTKQSEAEHKQTLGGFVVPRSCHMPLSSSSWPPDRPTVEDLEGSGCVQDADPWRGPMCGRACRTFTRCVVGFRFCIKSIKTHAFVSYAK